MKVKLITLGTVLLVGGVVFAPSSLFAYNDDTDVTKSRMRASFSPKPGFGERLEAKKEYFKDTRAILKNVKVTAVGASSLTVDNEGTSVTVNITDKTQLRRKFWGKSAMDEFSVGDTVNVIGKWTDDTKTAVNAVMIRNESIQKRFGVFFGTIKSLTSDGFVMTTIQREDQTVTLGPAKLINRKGETIAITDIKVGDRVRVRGLWNKDADTITETSEIKNFSLPPRVTPAASSTP